jgi:hypothetical protein
MSDSAQLPPEEQKPMSRWKIFLVFYFGGLFLIGSTIWVIVQIVTFIYNKTIGSSVDGFLASNSNEDLIFMAWLIAVGLFIWNVWRNG